jgi:hypothetical protein
VTITTHFLFEGFPLLQSQGVGLSDDGNNIDDFAELLHDDHINRAERVASWIDEKQGTVDARVLDVAIALCRELFAKICAVLILNTESALLQVGYNSNTTLMYLTMGSQLSERS